MKFQFVRLKKTLDAIVLLLVRRVLTYLMFYRITNSSLKLKLKVLIFLILISSSFLNFKSK